MSPLNDPAILAEIAAHHDGYERALAANDVSALTAYFWDSPSVVRFGVSEHLYGSAAIAAYRSDAPPVFTDRRITRRTITAFGADFASVMCEIAQCVAGVPRLSRQSQTWVRFADHGWKIVAAHVSHAAERRDPWETYALSVAASLQVPLAAAHRPGVVANLQRAAVLAAPLLEFPLPDEAEIAPVFAP